MTKLRCRGWGGSAENRLCRLGRSNRIRQKKSTCTTAWQLCCLPRARHLELAELTTSVAKHHHEDDIMWIRKRRDLPYHLAFSWRVAWT